jgi:putative FmdB family regulatory protein
MPIYEYECNKCHSRFEKKGSYSDKPEAVCPQCSGKSKRIMSVGAVIYKGSGFYITDQRKEKEIANIGKPSKELAEKYPEYSGLDKKTDSEKTTVSVKEPITDKKADAGKASTPEKAPAAEKSASADKSATADKK